MAELRTLLTSEKFNLEKVHCLIVDDNQQSRDIIATVCVGFGIRNVTKCGSVDEAKAAINSEVFDLVLTDAEMPDTSGYDLVRWIRHDAIEANRFVPVLLVTGHTRVSQILRARDCGAHFTIAKPVTPKILLERIFWVARDERAMVECDAYSGPDRRFKREGPPPDTAGRRRDDVSAGEAVEDNVSRDGTGAPVEPAKVSV